MKFHTPKRKLPAYHCLHHLPPIRPHVNLQHRGHLLFHYFIKQVAQLWQRDRSKLDMFSINIQHY